MTRIPSWYFFFYSRSIVDRVVSFCFLRNEFSQTIVDERYRTGICPLDCRGIVYALGNFRGEVQRAN